MSPKRKKRSYFNRLSILIAVSILISLTVSIRLAQLQILEHKKYLGIAQEEQLGYTKLPARRGEILTRDYSSNDKVKLATNITLNTIYADPGLIKNPQLVAETLAPLLIDIAEERKKDQKRVEQGKELAALSQEKNPIVPTPKTDQELFDSYKQNLAQQVGQKVRSKILLEETISETAQREIEKLNMQGIEIDKDSVYAKPPEINNKKEAARLLSPLLNIEEEHLRKVLEGLNRYVILKRKLDPALSSQIKKILENDTKGDFFGIRLEEEYYRFYPEGNFASQVIGFVDSNKIGQYGIEEAFNNILQGREGIFMARRDGSGKLITVGDTTFTPAQNGSNIILTIDRAIQLQVEKELKKAYQEFNPDSIQVIIMDPWNGKILAMGHEPTFDPNDFAKVYTKEEIFLNPNEITRIKTIDRGDHEEYYLYYNEDTDEKIQLFIEEDSNGKTLYKRYKNKFGPMVYRNHLVSEPYEPGSVMKVITMAAGINDGDIIPTMISPYSGPRQVDCKRDGTCENEIGNAGNKYYTRETMTEVLAHSSNVGISFVAEKLGKQLLYDYLMRFGFGHRTDIEFANEHPGEIRWPNKWSQSDHITAAFGQGLTVTALQMATATAAIANGGLLIQPHIIDSIEHASGEIVTFEPQIIQRAITQETADTITSMMINAIENGVAKKAQVKTHYVAGKTGTAQRYKNGKPLEGIGTTIGSFIGFAPVNNPKFVILIKVDRPRRPTVWAGENAAPLFSSLAEFLFQYYNIPPDKK